MSWHPNDPRLRRKVIPGESWHSRILREAAERGPRQDWAQRLQRPTSEQTESHYEAPTPAPAPEYKAPAAQPNKVLGLPKKGRGRAYELAFAYYFKKAQGLYTGGNGLPAGISVTDDEDARRDARRAWEEKRGVEIEVNSGTTKRTKVLAGLSSRSRKPGGKKRSGQRSKERRVEVPTIPPDGWRIFGLFKRRRRGAGNRAWSWHMRSLAVIAVRMSLPPGTSNKAMGEMRPAEVLQLRMPLQAWTTVIRWLEMRRGLLGEESDRQPWLTYYGSNGVLRQVGSGAVRLLHRAGLPGWRLCKLKRARWDGFCRVVSLSKVARRLIAWDSPLRALAI